MGDQDPPIIQFILTPSHFVIFAIWDDLLISTAPPPRICELKVVLILYVLLKG